MGKRFLKTAWRNLLKNRLSSAINIAGLSVGLAVAIAIGLWVRDELTFDFIHSNHDQIARVMETESVNGERNTSDIVPVPLADYLRKSYGSDFEQVAVVFPNFTHTVSIGDKKLSQSGQWVQSGFPEMLSLKMLKGDRNALKDPSSVLLSQSLAQALFGSSDPMNKALRLDNTTEVRVGGVYRDLPLNSSFHETKLFLSWDKALTVMSWLKDASTQWDNPAQQIYVRLKPNAVMTTVSGKIRFDLAKHLKNKEAELQLFGMNHWHLHGEFKNGVISGGRIRYVWIFGLTGIFVLLLACINFMNLSTARSEKRAREVGIRKTIGSSRGQLIGIFLGEAVLISTLAVILSLAIVWISLPFFNELTGKALSLPFLNPRFTLTVAGFALLTGIIAGSYPAFYLSSFEPVKVLKGKLRPGRYESLPRKILVVLQFSFSISLIIATIVIYRQVRFARNRPVGYSRNGLIAVTMNTPEIYGAPYNALRNALLQTGVVTDMAKSSTASTEGPQNSTNIQWKGKAPGSGPVWGQVVVTHDFGHTMDWKILNGRDFSRGFSTDSGALILNETAVKLTGLANPIGESIRWDGKSHLVIGVVKDMIMESPYEPVRPTLFSLGFASEFYGALTVRINPAVSIREAIARIEPVFKEYNPNGSFEYKFVDAEYLQKFADEERVGNLATCFATLAIFISCLGLFGLATFVAEQRTKEIGIRKVLGATVGNVLGLLSREFIALVSLSFLLSAPIAFYFMHNWLQNYSYHTGLPWWLFAITGAGTMFLTLATVSVQALSPAMMNPVKSLKAE